MHDIEIIISGIKCLKSMAESAENTSLINALDDLKTGVDALQNKLNNNLESEMENEHHTLEDLQNYVTANCSSENIINIEDTIRVFITEINSYLP